jgi:hypothetical protein
LLTRVYYSSAICPHSYTNHNLILKENDPSAFCNILNLISTAYHIAVQLLTHVILSAVLALLNLILKENDPVLNSLTCVYFICDTPSFQFNFNG